MKNKNITITGGLGFIGGYIKDQLLENNQITIIDKKTNTCLPTHPNLTIINKDVNQIPLKEYLQDQDYIFHQSALVSVPESIKKPVQCYKDNLESTINILNATIDTNIKKVMFASSSAIYGDNPNTPLNENETPQVLSPYAASKISSEYILQSHTESYGIPTASLRYFNVFGPGQDLSSPYAAVIPLFVKALTNNKQATIFGDGEQTRDFIYVEEVAKANIHIAEHKNATGAFNIATGKPTSINTLYNTIMEIVGKNISPEYSDPRAGDIKHSLADTKKLEKTGFQVHVDLKKQLTETVNGHLD